MKSSGQTLDKEEAPRASLPPSEVKGEDPADPTTFDVVREGYRALNYARICPHMIRWGQAPEFVEKKFRRSRSLHTKRYYEAGVRRFRQFTESKGITDVNDESVYEVLDGFVQWLDALGIKPKTLTGYVHAAKKFLLFLDVRIDVTRIRNAV